MSEQVPQRFIPKTSITAGVCHRAGINIVHIHLSHCPPHAGSLIQCVPSSITSTHRTEASCPSWN